MVEKQNEDGTWSEAQPCRASWEESESDKRKKAMLTKLLALSMLKGAGATSEDFWGVQKFIEAKFMEGN